MRFLFLTMLLATLSLPARAQMKVAYADLDLVLALMPEAQRVNQELQQYAQNLQSSLQSKQNYLQTKYEEFQEEGMAAEQAGSQITEARMNEMREELTRLQNEVRQTQVNNEEKLMTRRMDKMQPLLNRIEDTIAEMAEAGGYTYILNASSAGTSTVLFGEEQYDLTRELLTRLNIPIPEGYDGE